MEGDLEGPYPYGPGMYRCIKLCRDLCCDLKRRPPSRISGWHAGGRAFLVAEIVDLLMSVTWRSGMTALPGNLARNAIRRARILTGRVCIDLSNCAATYVAI